MSVEVYADNVQVKNVSELGNYSSGDFDIISFSGGEMKKMSKSKLEEILEMDGVGLSMSVVNVTAVDEAAAINLSDLHNLDLIMVDSKIKLLSFSNSSVVSPAIQRFSVLFPCGDKSFAVEANGWTLIGESCDFTSDLYLMDIIVTSDTMIYKVTEVK